MDKNKDTLIVSGENTEPNKAANVENPTPNGQESDILEQKFIADVTKEPTTEIKERLAESTEEGTENTKDKTSATERELISSGSESKENLDTVEKTNEDLKRDESASEELDTDESVSEELDTDESVSEELDTDESVSEELDTDESVSEELDTDESTNEDLEADESASEELDTDEGVSEELDTDESASEELDTDESTNEDLERDESANEELDTDESVSEVLDTDESVSEELDTDESTNEDLEREERVTPRFVVDNIDDSQLLADEVGVSGVFDSYGREILEPVFENCLRLSKNSIKLAYSKIKNTILSYRDVKQRYMGATELFKKSNKILCRMEIGEDCINIYYALNFDELDKQKYTCHSAKSQYKQTPTRVTVLTGDKKCGEVYLTAINFVEKVMEQNEIERNRVYVPTAYAERYPYNIEAVLKGKEETPPDESVVTDREYDYIEGELTKDIIEEIMGPDFSLEDKQGKEKLDAIRQQATNIKGAVAITEPIIYFFDSALSSENVNMYVNIQQVLQDKFLGKMLPQQYTAVAESSIRIEQLNFLAISEAVVCADENPKLSFCLKISTRMLLKGSNLERLLKSCVTQNNNLIMAFDCALLEALGQEGMKAIESLKEIGVKIMLDNTENAGLKILTEYIIDYLRFDARYYKESNPRTTAHLDMLIGYCKIQGIATAATNVESTKEAKYFLSHGVDIIQGHIIAEPKRTIAGAVKEIRKLAAVSAN